MVPTFPDWQNSRISPANFQVFSLFLKWLPNSISLKSGTFNIFIWAKTWSFLQYPRVKPPFLAYLSNWEGAAMFLRPDRKQKIWSLQFFPGFIPFFRNSIENHEITRLIKVFQGYYEYSKFSKLSGNPVNNNRNIRILTPFGMGGVEILSISVLCMESIKSNATCQWYSISTKMFNNSYWSSLDCNLYIALWLVPGQPKYANYGAN